MLVDNPDGSQEIYDKLREQMGLEKPAGGILHVAGPSPNGGWRIVEVWESEEDAHRFLNDRLSRLSKPSGSQGRRRSRSSGRCTTT